MICPSCKKSLDRAIFYGIEVDYCPKCLGIFFEENELRLAKDEKDKNLNWLDIDLWKEKAKFKISPTQRLCPACRLLLYEINYGDSNIKIDLCNVCHGIWLDRGEFRMIIDYLKEESGFEVLNNYAKNLAEEFWEIFIGPESFREETLDFLTILKILNYKLIDQNPLISQIILQLPLTR